VLVVRNGTARTDSAGPSPFSPAERPIARVSAKEGKMNIGEPLRELDVEPLLYPAALPKAPAEPTPAPPPAADPAEVPA
jgi:hypothetical protein